MLKPGRARHEQISDWLRTAIQIGTFVSDDQIPSEHQLAQQFSVSRITIRRALQTLEHEGIIYRKQGLGSFVKETHVRQGLVRLTDFVEDMSQAGLTASSQVLHFGPEQASAEVSRALELTTDPTVFRLDRLRLGDHEPMAFDQTWMTPTYARLLEGHDLSRFTIYQILESQYDLSATKGHYRLEAVNANDEMADLLRVAHGHALLLITRTTYTKDQACLYYQRRFYRSDRVAYELDVARISGKVSPMPS